MRTLILTSVLFLSTFLTYSQAASANENPKFDIKGLQEEPFQLPYDNPFRTQVDYDQAISVGFQFNNSTFNETNGGSLEINGGSFISPPIDFSSNEALRLRFRVSTRGLGSGQKLSVSYSNDDGLTYQVFEVVTIPSEFNNFTLFLNLAPLDGTVGRIKIEMTEGTGSIHLRKFSIKEFAGYFYTHGQWTPSDPNGTTIIRNIAVANGSATFTDATYANNIHVYEDATLNIENVLVITGDLINLGNLVFISKDTIMGELGYLPSTSSITGNATVQRYINNRRAYRMLSSAVSTSSSIHDNWQEGATSNTHNPSAGFGTHITGSTLDQQNGFDGTSTGEPSMFTLDTELQNFVAVSNTDTDTLSAGKPYMMLVRGDRSININDPQASSETVLRATGGLHVGGNIQNFETSNAGDFAMFGNPYQSTVDIIEVFSHSANVNTNWYYVYDPNIATHGAYVTVELESGKNTSMSRVNHYLPPGQSAQFASLADGNSTVVFKEIDKAPGFFRLSDGDNQLSAENMITLQLFTTENYNQDGPVQDSFGIIFKDGNDNEITSEDAVKPMNFDENFGIDHSGTYLSIERRAMPEIDELYQLYSNNYRSSNYTLKITLDGLENSEFYLNDRFTRTNTLLQTGENIHSFEVSDSNPLSLATNRFSIGRAENLGINNNFLSEIYLYPNPLSDNTFYFSAPKLNGKQISVRINDLSGRRIFEKIFDCRDNTISVSINERLTAGVYLVTLKHDDEENTFRLVKK